jgi:L-glyceraldehyde 3-phosphate reductase
LGMIYRRAGRSGLMLPAVTLGLWQNFGAANDSESARAIVRSAFEAGITHFDLANNYGPPPGYAESLFGAILADDLAGHRDEIIVSTKAGYDMWAGPYGSGGSRKHLIASLDQSLQRMGLEYVDIFYSHRFDADTPLEETMSALADIVRAGKALYAGISSYSPAATRRAKDLLAGQGVPLTLHQPSYSMFNRWIEDELLELLGSQGVGCIAFSVLAQGMLSDKYVAGVPAEARASRPGPFNKAWLTDENVDRVRHLNEIAAQRGQSLAQMAVAWSLRNPVVTSALIGVSSGTQLAELVRALDHLEFSADELAAIDQYAVDLGIDIWRGFRVTG